MSNLLASLKNFSQKLIQKNVSSIQKRKVSVFRINHIDSQATLNLQRALKKAAKSQSLALALVISTNQSQYPQTYGMIKQLEIFQKNTKIPIYTFGEETALCGGYLLLCAGNRSFCDSTSLIGNLGVNYKHTNMSKLLNDNLGITLNNFTTNKESFIDRATFTSEALPDNREFFIPFNAHLHNKVVEVFEGMRKSKIKMAPEDYKENLLEGEVYTGIDAQKFGLVDELGNFYQILRKEFPEAEIIDISRPTGKEIFGNVFELFWLNLRTAPFQVLSRLLQK